MKKCGMCKKINYSDIVQYLWKLANHVTSLLTSLDKSKSYTSADNISKLKGCRSYQCCLCFIESALMKAPSIFLGFSYFLPTLFLDNQDKLLYFNTTETKFLSKRLCMKTVNLLRETNNQEAASLDFYFREYSRVRSLRDLRRYIQLVVKTGSQLTCARPFIKPNFIRQKMKFRRKIKSTAK